MWIAWPADYGNNVIMKGFFKCRNRERFFRSLPFFCCSKNMCCHVFFCRKAKTVCCVNALVLFWCTSCVNLPKSSVFISIHKFSGPEYILMWQNEETHAPFVNIKCRHGFPASLFPVSHLTAVGRHTILLQENKYLNNMQPDKTNCHIFSSLLFYMWLLCLPGQPLISSQVWNNSRAYTWQNDKEWSNYTWQALQNDGWKRTQDRGSSKWTVTLNDTGILF